MARFASLEEAQFDKLVNDRDAENTQRATRMAVKVFRGYLIEKGLSPDFELHEPGDLDSVLCKFYAEARKVGGELYKRSTLFSIKHGLNRHLSVHSPAAMDIIHGKDFRKSQLAFKAATRDLKRSGKGGISHYPPIEMNDLKIMYQYFDLQDNVKLQEKVFVDIVLYFGRRGRENLHKLRTSDFVTRRDSEGLLYIDLEKGKDTKNQQEDANPAERRMYALPDDPLYCPVTSFLEYKRRLNPNCVRFFQRPKRHHEHCHLWFDNVPMGHNTIGNMMAKISEKAGLSQRYTNHSLRTTLLHTRESAGDPSCPVSSFKKYSSKLHPDNPNFWQRPKKKFNKVKDTDEEWYDKVSVGKNALYAFMSNLSEEANLSQRYTNHCIRATSISTLDSQGVEAEDIIGISGHKHIRSVKSYNSNVDDQKKREMSDILCQNLPSNSAKTGRLDTASSSLSHTNSCTASVKEDHFSGMNEYRNLLVGDAASAWKRLVGRFYWLNDSDIAKHLIEVHDCYCGGSCPLERTHDEPNSGPQSSSKKHVIDLIPSTETDKDNRDVLLQLEVDEGAESIDEDSSGDSDLEHDEEFDIKQEQESVDDDTPPTSPESAYPRDDPLAPSTSSQASDAGGDNLTHTFTAVKQEPVETYSMKPAPETATADKSWPPKNAINTGSENTSNLPSSSLSSVTSNIALKSTAQTNPVIPIALIQNILQKSGRTTSNVRPPPLNTVTPSVRGVHPLLNTVTSSVRDVHPPLNTATSSVRDVHPPFSQNSAVTQNVAVTPSANIVRAQLPPLNTAVVGNAGNLPQSIPYYTIQRGNTLYLQQAPNPRVLQQAPTQHVLQQAPTPHVVQQAPTSQSPAQTFLNVISCQNATLPLPPGVDFQSLSQVSQGLPVAARNFGTLQSIDPVSVQPVCATTASGTTLQRGEQQCYKDGKQLDWGQGQKDKKNETSLGNSLAMEGNFTSRESVKRPLSESDDGPGTSKRLVTIKEEKDSDA